MIFNIFVDVNNMSVIGGVILSGKNDLKNGLIFDFGSF